MNVSAETNLLDLIIPALQIVIALALINVWVLRFNKATAYRGGMARNMREEFAVYGLPGWFMVLIGAAKLAVAAGLLAGLWYPVLIFPCALMTTGLMLGAVGMHFKVGDPIKKSLPATLMLIMAALLSYLS